MKRRITQQDLISMQGMAKDFYLSLPAGGRLPGMRRAMTPSEVQALSFLDAALTILGNTEVEVAVEFPDSDSILED
jgi:hypothetical protein